MVEPHYKISLYSEIIIFPARKLALCVADPKPNTTY